MDDKDARAATDEAPAPERLRSPGLRRLLSTLALCAVVGLCASLGPTLWARGRSDEGRIAWGLLDETIVPVFWPAPWSDHRFSALNAVVRTQAETYRDETAAERFLETLIFFEGALCDRALRAVLRPGRAAPAQAYGAMAVGARRSQRHRRRQVRLASGRSGCLGGSEATSRTRAGASEPYVRCADASSTLPKCSAI